MQPGTYEYGFQCDLPTTLPTSFEGEFGYIRYTATVCLDRVMWPDQIFEESITVINPVVKYDNTTNSKVIEFE